MPFLRGLLSLYILLIYSVSAHAGMKAAVDAAYDKDYSTAYSLARSANNRDITDVVRWLDYRDRNQRHSAETIQHFVNTHPSWPNEDRLLANAEYELSPSNSAQIKRFFANQKPQTDYGLLLHARVYQAPAAQFKPLWIEHLSRHHRFELNKRERGMMRRSDFHKRISFLLMHKRISEAETLFHYMDKDHLKLYEARIALIRKKKNVNALIDQVPSTLRNDPGLIYNRVVWRTKSKNYHGAYDILRSIKGEQLAPNRWWKQRKRIIRELIEENAYSKAYHLAKHHGTEAGTGAYAEAQWLAGWLGLRYQNRPKEAYRFFYDMYNNVGYPISRSRAAYWAGRAAEANNNRDIAKSWYQKAAIHPTTFYGQVASLKLNKKDITLPKTPTITRADKKQLEQKSAYRVLQLLHKIGAHNVAESFVKALVENAKTPGEMAYVGEFGLRTKQYQLAVIAGKTAIKKGVFLREASYPILPQTPRHYAELPLVYGIIRQESIFNIAAKSHANAMGLMQLIPGTARKTSQDLGLPYSKARLTTDPSYNIQLGSYYIQHLLDEYRTYHPIAIASYNAGPGNANKWVRRFGDPRDIGTVEATIDWLEKIPFSETRNYVQRVLEGKNTYQILLKNQPLTIASDITSSRRQTAMGE